jgi:tetratricopeptide (TPR) repeat protein
MWLERDYQFRDEGRRFVRAALQLLDQTIASGDAGRLWLAHGLLTIFSDGDNVLASFERAASLCSEGGSDQTACHALLECGRMLTRKGRFEEAGRALRQSQTFLNHAPVPKLQGLHCQASGFHSQMTGDFVKAQSFFRAALKWFVDSGSETLLLHAVNDVADMTWALEDLEGAVEEFREAVRLARASRFANEHAIGVPLGNVASVLIEQGNLEEAAALAREALVLLAASEDAWRFFDSLALRLALLGSHEDAARLLGFADDAFRKGSEMREVNEQRLRTRLLLLLSARFEEAELNELLRKGADLSEKEALSIAL